LIDDAIAGCAIVAARSIESSGALPIGSTTSPGHENFYAMLEKRCFAVTHAAAYFHAPQGTSLGGSQQ
jgi:hypothetical protein